MVHKRTFVIAGGGAAGFFAAIHAAENHPGARIVVLEKSREPLAKVAISGGGRCNVTHACFDPAQLVTYYPRGARELRGLFHRWQPRDTMNWFEQRGVPLKIEKDGRVFPVSDHSGDITHALRNAAKQHGVELWTLRSLESAQRVGDEFSLSLRDGEPLRCDALMLATGGNQGSRGHAIAASFGHRIELPVPSLFTFHADDPRIRGLQGLSVPTARLEVEGENLSSEGPLLITHWGFSGPSVLRLSAWGARRLAELNYDFVLRVCWEAAATADGMRSRWNAFREGQGRKGVRHTAMGEMPQRLWSALVDASGIPDQRTWSMLTRTEEDQLTRQWVDSRFPIQGKTLFKEEFVTCGGVSLSEVDFRTMESRLCPGLYFGGELLDIDGVTGGFNLQAAWATGRAAGLAMGGAYA